MSRELIIAKDGYTIWSSMKGMSNEDIREEEGAKGRDLYRDGGRAQVDENLRH